MTRIPKTSAELRMVPSGPLVTISPLHAPPSPGKWGVYADGFLVFRAVSHGDAQAKAGVLRAADPDAPLTDLLDAIQEAAL